MLIDTATQKPVTDGKWLLNIANYGDTTKTVSVYVNGKKVEQAVNLIVESEFASPE